ncbi:MAG: YggT family protein [bacterium]|nr:YggT family protein [bacterium]
MFILSNFISAIAKILDMVLSFYYWIIIARAILSWVNPDPYNPIVQFLYKVTEPVLRPIRRHIPIPNIGIDISPFIVFIIIYFLNSFLVQSLVDLAVKLKH